MEVLHAITGLSNVADLQFLKDGDKYTVAWYREGHRKLLWRSQGEIIKWSLMPTTTSMFIEMDKFILSYFPESFITLVALEMS